MTNNNAKIRDRSEVLCPAIVKVFARDKGIVSLAKFELAMYKFLDVIDGQTNTTPAKAWKGEPMDRSRAVRVADFFGLNGDYSQLQLPLLPQWVELLNNKGKPNGFMAFEVVKNDRDMVDFGFANLDGLEHVPIDVRWRLKFTGEVGDEVLVLLRSTREFYLLAPLAIEQGFNSNFESKELVYPQKSISFDLNGGLGWREFIAVKAKNIPFLPRYPEQGFSVSLADLELFAQRVLAENELVEIDRYEFVLAD